MTTEIVPQPGPLSRRDVWLTIALAVAKGDITEPCQIDVYGGPGRPHHRVELLYRHDFRSDPVGDARRAAQFFGIDYDRQIASGGDVWWGERHGWHWTIRAYLPAPAQPASDTALDEQVMAAIAAGSAS